MESSEIDWKSEILAQDNFIQLLFGIQYESARPRNKKVIQAITTTFRAFLPEIISGRGMFSKKENFGKSLLEATATLAGGAALGATGLLPAYLVARAINLISARSFAKENKKNRELQGVNGKYSPVGNLRVAGVGFSAEDKKYYADNPQALEKLLAAKEANKKLGHEVLSQASIFENLGEQTIRLLHQAERSTHDFLQEKVRSLGMDPARIVALPQVEYIHEPGVHSLWTDKGGVHLPEANSIFVRTNDPSLLYKASVASHELIHAATMHKSHYLYSKPGKWPAQERGSLISNGLDSTVIRDEQMNPLRQLWKIIRGKKITEKRQIATGLENGFTVWDEFDCYQTKLIGVFPQEAQERLQYALSHRSDVGIPNSERTFFLRKSLENNADQPFYFDSWTFLCYQGAQSAAKLIGLYDFMSNPGNRNKPLPDGEALLQRGRRLVDIDRFTGTKTSVNLLTRALGNKASAILNYPDDAESDELIRVNNTTVNCYLHLVNQWQRKK